MSIETATKIQDLNPVNPLDADPIYQGAAHIRMIKDCLQNPASAFTPTGVVVAFAGAAAPDGWLLCNGASLLKADYPDLAIVLGTTYGAGDADHFVLPELRGYFIRGVNTSGSGIDYGRALGNVQTDALISHTHTVAHDHSASIANLDHTHAYTYGYTTATTPNFLDTGASYGDDTQTSTTSGATYTATPAVTVNSATPTTSGPSTGVSTETRPYNVAMNYIIKY